MIQLLHLFILAHLTRCTDSSRVPKIEEATAEIDAKRRDFTINALFYNLQEDRIEDLTGHGLDDLARRFIRTPLPALQTFLDDPLRVRPRSMLCISLNRPQVLRAVRFSSRLHFALCPELVAAACSAEIKSALLHKVSRERVYKEVEGMIIHSECRPVIAFLLLHNMGLLDVVLPVAGAAVVPNAYLAADSKLGRLFPDRFDFLGHWPHAAMEAMCFVNYLLQIGFPSNYDGRLTKEQLSRSHASGSAHIKPLYWAALVHPLTESTVEERKRDTIKHVSFVHVLLCHEVKMETATVRSIQTLLSVALGFIAASHKDRLSLDDAARIVREGKELWRDGLLLATAMELASLTIRGEEPLQARLQQGELTDVVLS